MSEIDTAMMPQIDSWEKVEKILDNEHAKSVTEGFILAKKLYKQADEERTKLTKPILAAKRNVDDKAKVVLDPLKKVITHCAGLIEKWEQTERLREISETAVAAMEEEDKERAKDMIAFAGKECGYKAPGLRWTKELDYRTTESAFVPREYMTLDDKKIKAALKAGLKIPGIEAYTRYKVGVTGK